MEHSFQTKEQARQWVWEVLEARKAARFPFPPHGRIPNFHGARQAAERLAAEPIFQGVHRIKVNPDAPQRPIRELALAAGITVYVPTPRLRGGFRQLDPAEIDPRDYAKAASLSKGAGYARDIPLAELPDVDLIVTGSVAVTRQGRRCGKGHGYGDLEYAIYRELGHPAVPVVTTVHPLQLVGDFPADAHDLPVSLIVTAEETMTVDDPPPAPAGIDWPTLPDDAFHQMPILQELRHIKPSD